MSIFLLVVLFFLDGAPKIGVEPFATRAECEASISSVTSDLVKNNINQGSVSCVEYKIGTFG